MSACHSSRGCHIAIILAQLACLSTLDKTVPLALEEFEKTACFITLQMSKPERQQSGACDLMQCDAAALIVAGSPSIVVDSLSIVVDSLCSWRMYKMRIEQLLA